jgi:hypothetical protein
MALPTNGPGLLPPVVDGIPAEIRTAKRWAPWRAVWDEKKRKYAKIPHRPERPEHGLSNKSAAGWGVFDRAIQAYYDNINGPPVYDRNGAQIVFGGVGYLMTGPHGLTGIDLDHCVKDGVLDEFAAQVVAQLDSYTEISPSGTGLHVITSGDVPEDWSNHERGVEVYGGNVARFLTITGVRLAGSPATIRAPRQPGAIAALAQLYRKAPTKAEVEDLHLPSLIPDLLLPELSELELPPHAANFLSDGPAPGDRSRQLFATSIALHQAGLSREMVLSVLEANEYAMEVALDHRHQDYDKALRYLWKENCQVGAARAGELAALALDEFDEMVVEVDQRQPQDDIAIPISGDVADDFDDMTADADEAPPTVRDLAPVKVPMFTPVTPAQFLRRKPGTWLIKGLLPRAGLGVIYGASGAGKTFLTLDLVGALARGIPWRGKTAAKARCVYIVAEGAGGFRNRLAAYCQAHGLDPEDFDIGIIAEAPNMMTKIVVDALLAALKAFGHIDLVIIDTYARVMVGGNENDSKDAGMVIAQCGRIHRATGALVILVHHSGKDINSGARGSSALRAAADVELEVVATDHFRAVRITKMKDGEQGAEYRFKLNSVVIGMDEEDEDITSCVVEQLADTGPAKVRMKQLNKRQLLIMSVFEDCAGLASDTVHTLDLKSAAVQRIDPDPTKKTDNRGRDVARDIEHLVRAGALVDAGNGHLSLPGA